MTNEARVLRALRIQNKLSIAKAGQLMGLSDSYISHLETGRLDIPQGQKPDRILSVMEILSRKASLNEFASSEKLLHQKTSS